MLPIQQNTYHTMPNIIPEKYLHIFMQNRQSQTRYESFVCYDLRVNTQHMASIRAAVFSVREIYFLKNKIIVSPQYNKHINFV